MSLFRYYTTFTYPLPEPPSRSSSYTPILKDVQQAYAAHVQHSLAHSSTLCELRQQRQADFEREEQRLSDIQKKVSVQACDCFRSVFSHLHDQALNRGNTLFVLNKNTLRDLDSCYVEGGVTHMQARIANRLRHEGFKVVSPHPTVLHVLLPN